MSKLLEMFLLRWERICDSIILPLALSLLVIAICVLSALFGG